MMVGAFSKTYQLQRARVEKCCIHKALSYQAFATFHVDYSLLSSWSQIIEKLIKPRDHDIEVIEIRTNRKQDRLTPVNF